MKPQVGLSQEQVNKLKGNTGINQGLLAQYKPVAPITPSSLNSNETPAQVTAPTVPTQATSLQGSIQAGTDQFTKNQERGYEEALTNKQSSLQDYVGSLLEPGEIARTVDKYGQKGGVDTLEVELNDINDQIRQEQTALARQTEAIQKEAGLTKGQIDQQVAEVGRVSTRKQADLYIIQQGVQGRYDSAKAIADRAVKAEMEVVKQKQDILKTLYEDNKDLFTTAEQRLYDTKLADRNRALDAEEAQMKEISDLSMNALSNNAPTSVVLAMRNAGSIEEAIQAGGQYIDAYDRSLKALQIQNLKSQISERNAVTTEGKPLTQAQYTALGYGQRTAEADAVIDKIGRQFTGASSIVGSFLPNIAKSDDRQKFEQAQRNFINAVLRRESGAVISDEEFANARQQYFPVPGDGSEVLLQKDANRAMVTRNLLREGGQDTTPQDALINDPLRVGVNPTTDNPLGI